MKGDHDPVSIGELLGRMVEQMGWEERVALGTLRRDWAAVVGDQVAAHSEPVRLADGVLTVRAEAGAWATELTLLAASMADKAARHLGGGTAVREARVVVGERRGTPAG